MKNQREIINKISFIDPCIILGKDIFRREKNIISLCLWKVVSVPLPSLCIVIKMYLANVNGFSEFAPYVFLCKFLCVFKYSELTPCRHNTNRYTALQAFA